MTIEAWQPKERRPINKKLLTATRPTLPTGLSKQEKIDLLMPDLVDQLQGVDDETKMKILQALTNHG